MPRVSRAALTAIGLATAAFGNRAVADSCPAPPTQFHPGWKRTSNTPLGISSRPPPSEGPVGRLCAVELYTPAAGGPRPTDLVIESDGREIPFSISGPSRVAVTGSSGCYPQSVQTRSIDYDLFTMTPVDPLPASAELRVRAKGSPVPLVSFTTTANLDGEGCQERPGPPVAEHCSPGYQNCAGASPGTSGGSGGGCAVAPSRKREEPGLALAAVSALAAARVRARRRRGHRPTRG